MTRAALLVGINEYEDGSDLRGCCNDVDRMYGVLRDIYGYQQKEIIMLKNKMATRDAILEQLYILVGNLEDGDVGFFHFSGHGSQVADKDGDEADHLDELICPHDMSFAKKIYITDDELSMIFSGISTGAWLEVILDSCFSGTATRFNRSITNRNQNRTIVSPHAGIKVPVRRMKRAVEHVGNHVLWSGCAENQTSADAYINGDFNGAFTYYWVQSLLKNKNRPRHKLLEKVREALSKRGYDQVPQLEVSFGAQ